MLVYIVQVTLLKPEINKTCVIYIATFAQPDAIMTNIEPVAAVYKEPDVRAGNNTCVVYVEQEEYPLRNGSAITD